MDKCPDGIECRMNIQLCLLLSAAITMSINIVRISLLILATQFSIISTNVLGSNAGEVRISKERFDILTAKGKNMTDTEKKEWKREVEFQYSDNSKKRAENMFRESYKEIEMSNQFPQGNMQNYEAAEREYKLENAKQNEQVKQITAYANYSIMIEGMLYPRKGVSNHSLDFGNIDNEGRRKIMVECDADIINLIKETNARRKKFGFLNHILADQVNGDRVDYTSMLAISSEAQQMRENGENIANSVLGMLAAKLTEEKNYDAEIYFNSQKELIPKEIRYYYSNIMQYQN